MKEKHHKNEDHKTDAFLRFSSKLVNQVIHNKKVILQVMAFVVLGSIGWLGYSLFQEKQETKATQALYHWESKIEKLQEKWSESKESSSSSKKEKAPKKKDNVAKLTKEQKFKKLSPLLEGFQSEILKHKKTKAAIYSAIQLANIYLTYEKPQKANEVLNVIKSSLAVSSKHPLYMFFYSMLGRVQTLNNNCQEAIQSYKHVDKQKVFSFLKPEILYRIGVCQYRLNQWEKALSTFKQIKEDYSQAFVSQEAKKYIRLIQLQKAKKEEGV
ncbi:MAG: hypothetical protein D6797_01485 [Bdellovibrio sp.]|nr:MAG: hypothetical protein D6797_01485 [Bdellovibrio sp.]